MTTPIKTHDLLIEIGCEELPAKNLKKLQSAFIEEIAKGLKNVELSFNDIQGFVTPRRLAVRVTQLSTDQPTRSIVKKGPTKVAAFDQNGNPTKAALGFAESCGVPFEHLTLQETNKGSWFVFEKNEPGKTSSLLIPNIVVDALNNLPVTRRMRWGNTDYSFVRPIHWVVLLFGDTPIEAELFGVKSGQFTYGHRFHHPKRISITLPKEYEFILQTSYVMADFDKRRDFIKTNMLDIAKQHHFQPLINDDLLDEVTGLVEWSQVLLGRFDHSFLGVPREALISSMQTHQKCFAVMDNAKEKLLPMFLIVSNIQSKDPISVIAGNERVMQARLADAAFYYRVDKEISLHQRREDLKQVVFQAGLGTLWDKSKRLAHIAQSIARTIGADPMYTEHAALLCKADLLTQMVGEFPELQGIMGRYYALHHSEPENVAIAIEEHYYPRFAQDILPTTLEGCALALADRIDSLVGIFGLGKRPTGDKDPFALRRQAIGMLRILVEKQLNLDLCVLLTLAKECYENSLPTQDIIQPIVHFCFERSRAWYQDQGIPTKVFDAVLANHPTNPLDFHKRLQAVNHFRNLVESDALAAANKRVQNILTKSGCSISSGEKINTLLLIEEAEKNLATAVSSKEQEIAPLLKAGNYTDALKALATLREPVDQFFTHVMVMVDNADLRNNRLILLNQLRTLFLGIADISLL